MNFYTSILLFIGGGIGTLARYGISLWTLPISKDLPVGTLLINILGSLVIGFFGALTLANGKFPVPENARLFVMVGLCGGFTTFSAFSLQTLDLLRNGFVSRAILNIVLSIMLCIAAVAVGHLLAARFNSNATLIAQIDIEEEA